MTAPIVEADGASLLPAQCGRVGPFAAALLCAVLALPYLDHRATSDRLHAARGSRFAQSGAPLIADGAYAWRAISFTVLQAAFFSVLGEHGGGTLASVLAVMALAAGLFVGSGWLPAHMGGSHRRNFCFDCPDDPNGPVPAVSMHCLTLTAGAMTLLAYYACLAAGRRRVAFSRRRARVPGLVHDLQSTTVITPMCDWSFDDCRRQ